MLVQYLVVDGSLDADMAQKVAEKRSAIRRALDGPLQEPAPLDVRAWQLGVDEHGEPLPEMAAEQKAAILAALRVLANLDPDGATERNGEGFGQSDTAMGHQLAAESELSNAEAWAGLAIVQRYHAQVPADLLRRAGAD